MLILLGLCFGSFVNALVWRLHKKRNFVTERSECTHCHHVLAWNDLIPVVSWLSLRGKCRYCKKPIEDTPLTEISVALLFTGSYVVWPYGFEAAGILLFVLWAVALVWMAALSLYDARWMLLPDKLNIPFIFLGVVIGGVRFVGVEHLSFEAAAWEMILGIGMIAGLYGLLYGVSKGAWIGFGDVKLALFIGAVLGWQQALLALLLANICALLLVLPQLMQRKLSTKAHVPFGPFLLLGCVLAFLIGEPIISWYLSGLGLV